MTDNAQAMVLASLAADALALGAHWIYDTDKIAREIGRVERLLPPPPGSYHAGKGRGDTGDRVAPCGMEDDPGERNQHNVSGVCGEVANLQIR